MKRILLGLLLSILMFPSQTIFAEDIVSNNTSTVVIVNKATNKLAYYKDGSHERTFNVATGKSKSQTPEGQFSIVNMTEAKPYLQDRIPGGHKDNPYGSHWLGLDIGQTQGHVYGIHGTNNNNIIGNHTDQGCISMKNDEIRWLYNRVDANATVIVTNSSQSFDHIFYEKITLPNLPKPEPPELPVPPAPPLPPISINVDGTKLNPPQHPILENGRVLVPMRYIFEKFGANVEWINEDRRVIATKGNMRVQLQIGSKHTRINGENFTIDVEPRIVKGSTFVPIRFVAEALHYNVSYDEVLRKVIIESLEENEPSILYVNDQYQRIDTIPFYKENGNIEQLYVPADFIFNKFGAEISWLPNEKKLLAIRNELVLELIIDSKQAKLNGVLFTSNYAPIEKNGKPYVPITVVDTLFGATSITTETTTIVDVTYELDQYVSLYFYAGGMYSYTGYVVDEVVYMPLSVVEEELGVEVTPATALENNQSVTEYEIATNKTKIQLHTDSYSAVVNGRLIRLNHPPRYMDGIHLLPMEFIVETLGFGTRPIYDNSIYIYKK